MNTLLSFYDQESAISHNIINRNSQKGIYKILDFKDFSNTLCM